MVSDTVLNLPIERIDCGALTLPDNPSLLAVVTLHEWLIFSQQCKAHPTLNPEFPPLAIKVEGRSLDLYWGKDWKEAQYIGMLYMETYGKQTAQELGKAIEKGFIHPRMVESTKLRGDDTYMAIYYEWFEDTAPFEPYTTWKAIGKALHYRITTGLDAS